MSLTFKRLQKNEKSILFGKQINRLKAIKFKLNGNEIKAFEGDSVFSAAIANSITCAGTHKGHDLALDDTLSLPIAHISANISSKDYLPIERTLAIDGAKYITLGGKKSTGFTKILNKVKSKTTLSLGVNFDDPNLFNEPWLNQEVDENINVDLLIIGAGVAGMSAAAHGANSTRKILLVEERAYCGGDAILFGNSSDEENPIEIISSLEKTIKTAKNIDLLTSSKAINITKNIVLVHKVEIKNNKAVGSIVQVKAKKIILATGCSDRLPIFSGNRVAGTMGLTSAFHLAYAFGVWPNEISTNTSAIISTNNIAYRFATLAADAGVKFEKIIDSRVDPNSRFIHFAKAYGIKTETGLKPKKITIDNSSDHLKLHVCLTLDETNTSFSPIKAKNIIIAGGWMPRLFLWQLSGGKITPTEGSFGLKAKGELNNIALAGSCANWSSTKAVCDSGINAFNLLFKRKTTSIVEKRIDPIFETLGGFTPITINKDNELAPQYYNYGKTLVYQGNSATNNILKNLYKINKNFPLDEIIAEKSLSLGDLSSAYVLRKLSIDDFDEIALERSIIALNICQSGIEQRNKPAKRKEKFLKIPNYLEGRFGENSSAWEISAPDEILFETGSLIFTNSTNNDPMQAIGVILGQRDNKNIALLSEKAAQSKQQLSILSNNSHHIAKVKKEYILL